MSRFSRRVTAALLGAAGLVVLASGSSTTVAGLPRPARPPSPPAAAAVVRVASEPAAAVLVPSLAGALDPRALVEKGECSRCHGVEGLGLHPAPRERSCAGCHAWIHGSRGDPAATAAGRARYPRWDRYVANIASFLEVPDLAASAARLRPDFVASFLRTPFQVRPALSESMFRTPFSAEEAAALGVWLTSQARRRAPGSAEARAAAAIPPSSAPADAQQGAALYDTLGCATCHALGRHVPSTAPVPVRGAPDLVFVARRMTAADLAAFIADPAAFGAETRMPKYPLTAAQAARVRDYLWAASTRGRSPAAAAPPDGGGREASGGQEGREGPHMEGGAAARHAPGRAAVKPPATYAEVRARVLDAVCVHCHMNPARNGGEGGPGNTGGLAYRGAGLDLETWAGVRRGVRDESGRQLSILAPTPDGGEPLLLRRLRRRVLEGRAERAGRPLPPSAEPGMPLGLPALGDAELALVERWLGAGAPGPDGRPARAHSQVTRESPPKTVGRPASARVVSRKRTTG